MTPDQLAKFEAWAKSQKYNLSKKFGLHEYNTTLIANAAWQACLAANAIDQPADDERERLREAAVLARNELRWMLRNFPDRRGGRYEEALHALDAALGTREDGE